MKVHRLSGWINDSVSFSAVFRPYQDDGRMIMIMKGCVQWNSVYE